MSFVVLLRYSSAQQEFVTRDYLHKHNCNFGDITFKTKKFYFVLCPIFGLRPTIGGKSLNTFFDQTNNFVFTQFGKICRCYRQIFYRVFLSVILHILFWILLKNESNK